METNYYLVAYSKKKIYFNQQNYIFAKFRQLSKVTYKLRCNATP